MEKIVTEVPHPNPKTVFVVHGRNGAARRGMFGFLRALGLIPLEWSQALRLTGEGTPYIGRVLDLAFDAAQAVVVLLSPDDIAYLRPEYATDESDPERHPQPQARPNVLFEAGMAFGRHPERTILVELGRLRPFSDVVGRHSVRMDGTPEKRTDLATRLQTAGCDVDFSGTDWLTAGDLAPPTEPGDGLPLGRRLPPESLRRPRIEARYASRGGGKGQIRITNYSGEDLFEVNLLLPEQMQNGFHIAGTLPVPKLPAGQTVAFSTNTFLGRDAEQFGADVTGRTADGETVTTCAFISLTG